jgi:dTDP-glucose pyrophosphorylase
MIRHVLERVPKDWEIYVVMNVEDYKKAPPNVFIPGRQHVILLDERTGGAAETVLKVKSHILDYADPVMVINCDQITTYSLDVFAKQCNAFSGGILTFKEYGDPRYSYAQGWPLVTRTAEKVPISEYATAGFYYFRQGILLWHAISRMMKMEDRHNGEYYLCPAYNHMQGEILNVVVPRDSVVTWGTPEELDAFKRSPRLQGLLRQS